MPTARAREYLTLLDQYQTIVRMAQGLGNLDAYRIPTIATTSHDTGRWEYGRPWLQGLNSGDAAGGAYMQVARRLDRPGATLASLPPAARQAIERAYATIEITDSVAQMGGHQVALIRGYSGRLQSAIDALERDVVSQAAGYHETTAILDKIAAGQLVARREDMAANQLLSHVLEQLLARSKRQRDSEAAAMNMRLGGLRDGRAAAPQCHPRCRERSPHAGGSPRRRRHINAHATNHHRRCLSSALRLGLQPAWAQWVVNDPTHDRSERGHRRAEEQPAADAELSSAIACVAWLLA